MAGLGRVWLKFDRLRKGKPREVALKKRILVPGIEESGEEVLGVEKLRKKVSKSAI